MKIDHQLALFSVLISCFLFCLPPTDAFAEHHVKVGFYENSPKIFTDENGKITGFWPELIEHIAGLENWQTEYVKGTWTEGLDRLKSQEIDIMPDVAYTEKRNTLYVFSESPVLMSWSRLYVHKENSSILSIQDLDGRKIAALKGSVNLEGMGGLREIISSFNLHCTLVELFTKMKSDLTAFCLISQMLKGSKKNRKRQRDNAIKRKKWRPSVWLPVELPMI